MIYKYIKPNSIEGGPKYINPNSIGGGVQSSRPTNLPNPLQGWNHIVVSENRPSCEGYCMKLSHKNILIDLNSLFYCFMVEHKTVCSIFYKCSLCNAKRLEEKIYIFCYLTQMHRFSSGGGVGG